MPSPALAALARQIQCFMLQSGTTAPAAVRLEITLSHPDGIELLLEIDGMLAANNTRGLQRQLCWRKTDSPQCVLSLFDNGGEMLLQQLLPMELHRHVQ